MFATSNLKEAGVGIGILTIVVAIMSRVLDTIQTTNVAGSTAYNTTQDGLAALGAFGDWFTVIVIVLIATVIIELLTYGMGQGRQ